MSTKIKETMFLMGYPKNGFPQPPRKRRPKKAPTKAKEHKFPKNWCKVDGKVLRNHALDVAIDRGERLEKIAELMDRTVGAKLLRGDASGLYYVERKHWNAIYKLAKGA